jgi:hypothetical protein
LDTQFLEVILIAQFALEVTQRLSPITQIQIGANRHLYQE